jgi:hypothetical protein
MNSLVHCQHMCWGCVRTGCSSEFGFSSSLLVSFMFLEELTRFTRWQSIPEIEDYCGAFGRTYTV